MGRMNLALPKFGPGNQPIRSCQEKSPNQMRLFTDSDDFPGEPRPIIAV